MIHQYLGWFLLILLHKSISAIAVLHGRDVLLTVLALLSNGRRQHIAFTWHGSDTCASHTSRTIALQESGGIAQDRAASHQHESHRACNAPIWDGQVHARPGQIADAFD